MPGRRTLGTLCSVSVGQVGAANDRWHRALRAIDPNQFVADAGGLDRLQEDLRYYARRRACRSVGVKARLLLHNAGNRLRIIQGSRFG